MREKLKFLIEDAWEQRDLLKDDEYRNAINEVIDLLAVVAD